MSEDSDYIAKLTKTTASNYSMQPGKGEYSRPGTPMDVRNHPANTVPNATEHYDGTTLGQDVPNPTGDQ